MSDGHKACTVTLRLSADEVGTLDAIGAWLGETRSATLYGQARALVVGGHYPGRRLLAAADRQDVVRDRRVVVRLSALVAHALALAAGDLGVTVSALQRALMLDEERRMVGSQGA